MLRRATWSRYPLLWQIIYSGKNRKLLKLLKPQKLLKPFCHTATIESMLHGQNGLSGSKEYRYEINSQFSRHRYDISQRKVISNLRTYF